MAVKAAVQPYSLSYTDVRVQILVIKYWSLDYMREFLHMRDVFS